jgi:hypothetical protein
MRGWSIALGLLAAGNAHAKCAAPHPVLAPDGGALPPNPIVYLFSPMPERLKPRVIARDAAQRPLPLKMTLASQTAAFAVYKLELAVASGSVDVELGYPEWTPATTHTAYTVEPAAARAHEAPHVEGPHAHSYTWTCSYQKSQDLELTSQAPVYRVEWAESEQDVRRGLTRKSLMPSRLERFFWDPRQPPLAREGRIELGYVSCLGGTFDWGATPIWVSVVALFPDGSETPAAPPRRIEPPR